MKHLSVPVSDELAEAIRSRMAAGGFGSISEYLRHAVRQDLEHAEEARLERLLIAGLESGQPAEVNDEWLEKRRRVLIERVSKRRGKQHA